MFFVDDLVEGEKHPHQNVEILQHALGLMLETYTELLAEPHDQVVQDVIEGVLPDDLEEIRHVLAQEILVLLV